MRKKTIIVLGTAILIFAGTASSQERNAEDADRLKIAALEALMSAPAERAIPVLSKVLQSDNSDEVKESALFVLGQLDTPEAQSLLLQTAREEGGSLQTEAVRMIGISGNPESLAVLSEIYAAGDADVREAVLEAFLIADDKKAIYEIALGTESPEEFDEAVDMLAAMGAIEELRTLIGRAGSSEELIDAYAVAGDVETLRQLALDGSDPDVQARAIEALGVVGGDDVESTLMEIYRSAATDQVREAALDGMLIADYDAGIIELYRASNDPVEKRELLEYLTAMDSDEMWTLIEEALEERR